MPKDNKSNDETDGNLQEDSLRSDGTVTVCGRMSFLPMAHATGPETPRNLQSNPLRVVTDILLEEQGGGNIDPFMACRLVLSVRPGSHRS